nr:hypothetical protein [Tanacetum cinerariifolium]
MKLVEQPIRPTPDPKTVNPEIIDKYYESVNLEQEVNGKNKFAYAPKTKISLPPKRDNPAKDTICHHCKEVGHWRRNCLSYHAKLKKRKNASEASTSELCQDTITTTTTTTIPNPARAEYGGASILNIVPTKKVDMTPYEIWHGYLRVWDYEALVKRDTPDKLDSRSIKCIFVGYPKEMMASGSHRLLEMSRSDKGLEIIQEEDTKLFENTSKEHNESDKGLEIIQEEDTKLFENTSKEHNEFAPIEVEPQSVRVPIRRSARIPQVLDRYRYYVDVEEYELGDLDEPSNYKASLAYPEFDKWLETMDMEMQSTKDN